MRRRRASLRLLLGLVLAAIVVSAPAGTAQASSVTVLGAGSTWDQIATTQWMADAHAKLGITINYQGVGSTAGRQFYIENQVDFGDSDIPFLPAELTQLQAEHKTFQYLPTVAGGTGIMYNLRTVSGKRINNLQLDSRALVGIFTGTITQWRDPVILADNPKIKAIIPNAKIIPVVRSDGSGTSAMFSDYLRQLQPAAWSVFCSKYGITPCGETSFWPLSVPGFVSQKGSDGVANYVQQQTSTITYVETGYALARNFPVALVKNASGHYVFPSAQNDATALKHARIQKDLISDLTGVHTAPEANAYPIAGYSYMITPTVVQDGFTTAKGNVLGRFILYAACAGQQKAASLGYAPLTPVLVQGVFAAVRRIPGAPTPPPISKCANPTITGVGNGGGPSGNPGGPSTTGGSGGTTGGSTGTGGSSSGGGKHSGGGSHHKHHTSTTGSSASSSTTTGAGVLPVAGLELTAAQLAARQQAALRAISAVQPASSTPLGLIALDVLVLVLCPWIIWHRRRSVAGSGDVGSSA